MFKLAFIPVVGLLTLLAPKFPITSANYALEIDGQSAGQIKKIEGGSTDKDVKLHLGMGQGKAMQEWVNLAFSNKPVPKTAIAHACNVNFESMFTQELVGAHITEVGFPALDGSSKEPAYLTVKLRATQIHLKKGNGKVVGSPRKEQPTSFSLDIPGLPSGRVAKIAPFSWKASSSGRSTVSDLNVDLPSTVVSPWLEAAKAKRNIGKGGLTLTTPDQVCRVNLHGVKVNAVRPPAKGAPTFAAKLGVESLSLDCRKR